MSEETNSATRRAVLGASAVGLFVAGRSTGAGSQASTTSAVSADANIAPVSRTFADRRALASYGNVGFGSLAELAEPRRRGTFVAHPRNAYREEIEADPFQAFYIASTTDQSIVWVRDFLGPASFDWGGAKGDGIADDAPFINAMLKNTRVSWFQIEDRRNHRLGSAIEIRRAIKVVGAGPLSSVLSTDKSIHAIDASLASTAEHGLHLADFGIVNVMPPGTANAGSGIRMRSAYLAKLSNLRITNFYNGIHSSQSNLSNFDGIYINGFRNAGILFDGDGNFDTRVSGFTISGDKIGMFAIRMDDMCDEMLFSDGVCSTSKYALYTSASVYAVNRRPEFCRFSRVSFDSCENGLDLANCTDFVFDASFISCRPNHGAVMGVRGSVENTQFIATSFFSNGKSAAVIGALAADIDFMACKFISNGTAKSNTFDTLVFAEGCGSFTLAHNRFREGWDVKGVPRYHVMIEKEGAVTYSMIGNHFSSAGTGNVLDNRIGMDHS